MTESSRENLSSLMDGELDRKGRKFLLRRLARDADMKANWNRMHTVRACLHQERLAGNDLVDRVASALESEPAPSRSLPARLLRPVAGGAIAASVAVMAIVGINSSMLQQQGAEPVDESEPGFVSRPTELDRPFTQSATPVNFSENRRTQRQRISGYVMRHHQAAGSTGFVSWVPIVADMNGNQSEDDAPPAEAEAQVGEP
ncbi:sigma-E factor negative regulatory protein [Wenzhouxiangella sp. EGI_FJ10305]|uniref:sigma-E factor negative regulatory protein n=1 Tax=Wenzhouxiangella sp. EGI_FJ10305 TaxID=3243768 RepID=UPI0035D66687